MDDNGERYARVSRPTEVQALLKRLSQPDGASLRLETGAGTALPVFVETREVGDTLRLDVSAIRDHLDARSAQRGAAFRVLGADAGVPFRTPVLTITRVQEDSERLYFECAFPGYLEKLQRRNDFRATLRLSMIVRADLYDSGASASGPLRDLSIHGCQVELDPDAGALLRDPDRPLHVEFTFPDGSYFHAKAWPRHVTERDSRLLCGFRLVTDSPADEQRAWHLVREIEREAARSAYSAGENLRPSSLFEGDGVNSVEAGAGSVWYIPFASQMAQCAAFIANQMVRLCRGANIEPEPLSRHADELLELQQEDREGLLFALECQQQQPLLVRHCLAVAVRLVDMGTVLGLPHPVLKALAAAGLVHDLGEAALAAPGDGRQASGLELQQLARARIDLLRGRLADCTWLPPQAIQAVAEGTKERLDGSGFPQHRRAGQLNALMRLAAVVDAADAWTRGSAARNPQRIDAVYAYLRLHPEQFDARWVDRYIDHFGVWPVGTLVKFENGVLGWVLRLMAGGRLASVLAAADEGLAKTMAGKVVRGESLARLGNPVATVPRGP